MAALISSVMSTKDKVPFFVNRCDAMGIEVLPPDVNSSDHGFVVAGNSIRFGLDAVKNVGHQAVEAIIRSREAARALRLDLGLLRAGRLPRRQQAGDRVPGQVRRARLDGRQPRAGCSRCWRRRRARARRPRRTRAAARARSSTSEVARPEGPRAGRACGAQRLPVPAEEFDQRELLRLEKETLGTFLSAHPLTEVRDALRERVDCGLPDVAEKPDGTWLTVGGIIGEAKKVRTRSGSHVMFATLDDLEGQVELFVRNADGEEAKAIEVDKVVVVRGRVDHKGRGQTSVVVQDAELFEPDEAELAAAEAKAAAKRDPKEITLSIDAANFGPGLIDELKSLFEGFPGESEVLLVMRTTDGTRRLRFGDSYRISPSPPLRAQLAEVLGPTAIAA